jgi:lipopolysaccharide transport system ATP-binding protein
VNAVEFHSVSKSYAIYDSPVDRLTELLTAQQRPRHRDFWALDSVSFQLPRGEVLCIIGENGAGKSTLLQIVAGILAPSSGTAHVNGRVSALLELGSGFNPEFTGRDNVYMNAAILGLSTREIDRRYPLIQDFAEIGDFLTRPVKTYSSGMVVRLAFAVAIHADPDVLIVDEALSVGDGYFRQRCMRKVNDLRARGVTILFVSHSLGDVKAIGDRTLWLQGGRVRALGDTETVIASYVQEMADKDANYVRRGAAPQTHRPQFVQGIPNVDHRRGNGAAEIAGIAILDAQGQPTALLEPSARVTVRISVRAHRPLRRPVVGFTLRNHLGLDFAGTDTTRERLQLPPLTPGQACTVDFRLEIPELYPAFFSFSAAVGEGALDDTAICDWIDNAVTVQMSGGGNPTYGYMHLPCRIECNAMRSSQPSLKEAAID